MPDNEAALNWIASAADRGELPDWAATQPDTGGRSDILQEFSGTNDIAGAAEALASEGTIAYDQATPGDVKQALIDAGLPTTPGYRESLTQFDGVVDRPAPEETRFDFLQHLMDNFITGTRDGGDSWMHATRGNCADFVNLAGRFSCTNLDRWPCPQVNAVSGLIEPSTMQEWDGHSPIPRGKVVVGTTAKSLGGQGQDGFYHTGVSLGDGMVANNHGDGAQIEKLEDVFGGWSVYTFGKVYYGDYRCHTPKSDDELAEIAVTAPITIRTNPTTAVEQRTTTVKVGIGAAAAVALGAILFGGGGSEPPPLTSEQPVDAGPSDVPGAAPATGDEADTTTDGDAPAAQPEPALPAPADIYAVEDITAATASFPDELWGDWFLVDCTEDLAAFTPSSRCTWTRELPDSSGAAVPPLQPDHVTIEVHLLDGEARLPGALCHPRATPIDADGDYGGTPVSMTMCPACECKLVGGNTDAAFTRGTGVEDHYAIVVTVSWTEDEAHHVRADTDARDRLAAATGELVAMGISRVGVAR